MPRQPNEKAAALESISETEHGVTCPECSGALVHDEEHGETVCTDCGLIVDNNYVDRGPEWRAFTAEERNTRSRVGGPTTQLLHDKGLSTKIGWRNRDAYGQTLNRRKRQRIERLRTWNERARTRNASERNLKQALSEIQRMASALGLPTTVRGTASVIYQRALEEELLLGRSIEGMTTAALYAAARQAGMPRGLDEMEQVSRVPRLEIGRAYRYLCRELGLDVKPADPVRYLPRFASELEVTDDCERYARDLLETAKENGLHSGKSPVGLAAAALYAGALLTGETLTQGEVEAVANVSEVTIRNRYPELLAAAGYSTAGVSPRM